MREISKPLKIVVFGANGQLGQTYQTLSINYPWAQFYFFDKSQLDITDEQEIKKILLDIEPTYLINCAAYTAVDKAESDVDHCNRVNIEGCRAIVAAIGDLPIRVLHFSTDYVYGSFDGFPLRESLDVHPVNIYARSKYEGEKVLRNSNIQSMIIRTSWVISPFGNNFVKTMLRLAVEKEKISVVNDQFGAPTFTFDLVKDTLNIILMTETDQSKSDFWNDTYNYANEGVVTWYDISKMVMHEIGSKCEVVPIPSKSYPTSAPRPYWSVMSKKKILRCYGIIIPHWYQSVRTCIDMIKEII